MPHAVAPDGVRLYYEETGSGVPILFLHEFGGDYRSWEPQVRFFSRQFRCVHYSARGYLPSDIPPAGAYGYERFRDDAIAVLDHLKIAQAHFVGLSMGAYSSLQVSFRYPKRVLSLTLAGCGSGSEPGVTEEFRKQSRINAENYEKLGAREVAKLYGVTPNRVPFLVKDPRGFADFIEALSQHDAQGAAHTMREFQGGRPSLYDFEKKIQKLALPTLIICGDEDGPCLAPSLYLKKHLPASGLAIFPKSGHIINAEEPALFNETVQRFLALTEAGRWPARDPRSTRSQAGPRV